MLDLHNLIIMRIHLTSKTNSQKKKKVRKEMKRKYLSYFYNAIVIIPKIGCNYNKVFSVKENYVISSNSLFRIDVK